MRVIIPGASGLIGRNLLAKASRDWDIVATYRTDEGFPSFVEGLGSSKIAAQKCDLLNLRDLKSLGRTCGLNYDLCVYLAANSDPSRSFADPAFDLRNNTEALINFLQSFNIERFMFFSSGAVYEGLEGAVSPEMHPSPALPYAVSKLASEAYVKHFRKKGAISEYLIVRFFGAYGPYEHPRKIYTKLVERFHFDHNGEFSIRGNGLNFIDAMYVDDAIEGIIKMTHVPFGDTVTDFCRGSPMTIRDLVLEAARILNIPKPRITQEGKTQEYNRFYANPMPFMQRYNFKPKVELVEGLHKLANFLEDKQK